MENILSAPLKHRKLNYSKKSDSLTSFLITSIQIRRNRVYYLVN